MSHIRRVSNSLYLSRYHRNYHILEKDRYKILIFLFWHLPLLKTLCLSFFKMSMKYLIFNAEITYLLPCLNASITATSGLACSGLQCQALHFAQRWVHLDLDPQWTRDLSQCPASRGRSCGYVATPNICLYPSTSSISSTSVDHFNFNLKYFVVGGIWFFLYCFNSFHVLVLTYG